MPWDVTCPKCQQTFPVSEVREPIGIECPKCEAKLTVESRDTLGEVAPRLRVLVGYPPSATAYAALASQQVTDSSRRRRLSYKPPSMPGVMLAGLLTLLLSVGALGATGYALFANLERADSATQKATHRTAP
jgi:hypothetical protein